MRYVPREHTVEALFLDRTASIFGFLEPGEYTAINRHGVFVLTPMGSVFAPVGECYLVRWPTGIDVMDAATFEAQYQEEA